MVETSEKTSSPSSSNGRKDLEFFKVYLPDFSSHELVIPQAFIIILDKSLPKEVLLVDEMGRLWNVETKTEARVGVVFRKGWESFADDHSLEFGDFLLFRYDGHSRFDVTIYGKDGYPREMSWVPEKKHREFEEPVYKPQNPHFVRNITPGSLRLLEIPTTFLKANGIELEDGQNIELCDENGKKWPLKIEKHDRGHVFSYDSWLCFCESHILRNPNKCLFEFIVSCDGTCDQILVRIFRGMLLTTTTKTGYHVISM
ncbi:hypothetical protein Bca101_042379 [Brassica carinata]